MKKPGYIYIGQLEDANNSKTVLPYKKIGMTTTTPEQRSEEINPSVCMPVLYRNLKAWKVNDVSIEGVIHRMLKTQRCQGEFFDDHKGFVINQVEEFLSLSAIQIAYEIEEYEMEETGIKEPGVAGKWVLEITNENGEEIYADIQSHKDKYIAIVKDLCKDNNTDDILALNPKKFWVEDSERDTYMLDKWPNTRERISGRAFMDTGIWCDTKAQYLERIFKMWDISYTVKSFKI